jgi:surfactin synthase thioesterase subunit
MKRALKEKTINYPLVLTHGSRDSTVSKTDMAAWARYTSAHIGLHTVSSDHFFINHQPKEVADIVNQQLA